jgi:hypothetical protein
MHSPDQHQPSVRAAELVGQPRAQMLGETIGVFACYELGSFDEMAVHLERELQLVRQLGARRFEAQNLEMQARRLLHIGRRAEAVVPLRLGVDLVRCLTRHIHEMH